MFRLPVFSLFFTLLCSVTLGGRLNSTLFSCFIFSFVPPCLMFRLRRLCGFISFEGSVARPSPPVAQREPRTSASPVLLRSPAPAPASPKRRLMHLAKRTSFRVWNARTPRSRRAVDDPLNSSELFQPRTDTLGSLGLLTMRRERISNFGTHETKQQTLFGGKNPTNKMQNLHIITTTSKPAF